ncbi:quaternary ammonium compound efflux SMR transporter SugE [Spirosoma harenae]
MQAWLFLFIAAIFQTAWTYSLKYMVVDDLKTLRWDTFYLSTVGLPILLPFIGNAVFGLVNIYFFSLAIKQIPTTTAFAAWTAIGLLLIKAVDVFVFKNNWSFAELFFLALIAVGIIGLRFYSAT